MFKLLLLKHRYHEYSSVICADYRGGRVTILEYHLGCHALIRKKEAELAGVVEGLEDLRVEGNKRVWNMWLTLFGL